MFNIMNFFPHIAIEVDPQQVYYGQAEEFIELLKKGGLDFVL